jgi:hypothetical protein
MPKLFCEKCESWIASSWRYEKHVTKCTGQKPWRQRQPTNGMCKYCNSQHKPKSLGAHVVSCSLNPKRKEWIDNISRSQSGKKLSEKHKEKLSKTVTEKVQRDEWHYSFSKTRTHEYKGIKFHGMWEVKYAMFLDEMNIKWRRPTEKFKYSFQGKERYYTPDFHLPEENLYIEIKGYKVERDEAKWSQFPLKLKVVTGEDLVKLGILLDKEIKVIPT